MRRPEPGDAFSHLAEIGRRLGRRQAAFFLDYDGTLTPIVDRPSEAVLAVETRALLARLSGLATVAIISGRDREDVVTRVGLDRLIYAGSHGFDISGPAGLRMQHERARELLPELDLAETALRERLAELEGIAVERKTFAIAVHYRRARAERDVARAKRAVSEVRAERPSLVETEGKKVVELRPAVDWDKGRAVEYLLSALKLEPASTLPVYIGDDTTDEDAFAFLRRRGSGVGIVVGPPARSSEADYRLDDPEAVRRFLLLLLAGLEARG